LTSGRDNKQGSSALPEALGSSACSWIRGTRRAAAGQEDLGIEDRAASGGVRDKMNKRKTEISVNTGTDPTTDTSLPRRQLASMYTSIERHVTINHRVSKARELRALLRFTASSSTCLSLSVGLPGFLR
jgi:hypothetical protein